MTQTAEVSQKIFTETFLTTLRANLPQNLPFYEQTGVWISEAAGNSNFEIDSSIKINGDLKLKMPEDGNLHDLENSKLIYEAFRGLTRSQASDARLWTYLSHVSCWEYMTKRWSLSEKFKNETEEDRKKKLQVYILEHYFVRSDQSRALIRNGMARLWWYSYLTYDSSRENPYELTGILLKKLDIAKNVVERNLGRNKIVLNTILEFLLDKEDLINGGDTGRKSIRNLVQSLNLHGGFCILDSLSRQDIKSFLQKRYSQILNAGEPEFGDADENSYAELDE